jgi:hypothetical protein
MRSNRRTIPQKRKEITGKVAGKKNPETNSKAGRPTQCLRGV